MFGVKLNIIMIEFRGSETASCWIWIKHMNKFRGSETQLQVEFVLFNLALQGLTLEMTKVKGQ